jgi:hypothetical protein
MPACGKILSGGRSFVAKTGEEAPAAQEVFAAILGRASW